ncbi:AAR2 protein family [Trifolium pratense]|uniref:AAR2 protein family n=1 Tax=Trifolium pratense TaxID=57577 RepID=A0A2K3LU15_TRIPR|nr:AAR2 protein family [Trifolium pratense]
MIQDHHCWMILGFLLIAFCTIFVSYGFQDLEKDSSYFEHFESDFFSLVLDGSVVDGDILKWTRKFKELLENSLGWEFQQNSAVDGLYFDENDEFAPVVEMLDDEAHAV